MTQMLRKGSIDLFLSFSSCIRRLEKSGNRSEMGAYINLPFVILRSIGNNSLVNNEGISGQSRPICPSDTLRELVSCIGEE